MVPTRLTSYFTEKNSLGNRPANEPAPASIAYGSVAYVFVPNAELRQTPYAGASKLLLDVMSPGRAGYPRAEGDGPPFYAVLAALTIGARLAVADA